METNTFESVFDAHEIEKFKSTHNMKSKVSIEFLEGQVDMFSCFDNNMNAVSAVSLENNFSNGNPTLSNNLKEDYERESRIIIENFQNEKKIIENQYRNDIEINESDSGEEIKSKIYFKKRKKMQITQLKSRKKKEVTGTTPKEDLIHNSVRINYLNEPLAEEINILPEMTEEEMDKNIIRHKKKVQKPITNPVSEMQIFDQEKPLSDQKYYYQLDSSKQYLELMRQLEIKIPENSLQSEEDIRLELFVRLLNEEKNRKKRSVIEDLIRCNDQRTYGDYANTEVNDLDQRTRLFEEKFLREPLVDQNERPCGCGEFCEGMFIPGTRAIINVECMTYKQHITWKKDGKRLETSSLCVMCAREYIQYQWNNARSEKSTIKIPVIFSQYYNIAGQPGEYILDQMLQSSSSDYQGLLYPVAAHVRDWYEQEFDDSRGIYVWKQVGYCTISHYDESGKPHFH